MPNAPNSLRAWQGEHPSRDGTRTVICSRGFGEGGDGVSFRALRKALFSYATADTSKIFGQQTVQNSHFGHAAGETNERSQSFSKGNAAFWPAAGDTRLERFASARKEHNCSLNQAFRRVGS